MHWLPMVDSIFRTFLLILILFSMILQLYSIQYKIIYRIRIKSLIVNALIIIASIFLFEILCSLHKNLEIVYLWVEPIRQSRNLQLVIVCIILVLGILSFYFAFYDVKERNKLLYEKSIQEGFDAIDTGLCFFDVDGHLVLINHKMNEISQELLHTDILNGIKFMEFIESIDEIEGAKRLKTDDLSMIQLSDGTIYGFHCERICVENKIIYQLIATDITILYELNESIEKDNQRLSTMNERLKKYNADVSRLTEREEILSTKMNIHNELGQALLATSHYLTNHTQNKEELLDMWKKNILLLKNEQNETKKESLAYLYDAGKAIGIDVVIDGSISNWSQRAVHIFNLATKESMTNAIKHAQANHLYIHLEYNPFEYKMVFTNDGVVCSAPYAEGGGLSGLRSRVEENGGDMNVNVDERFRMEIILPE